MWLRTVDALTPRISQTSSVDNSSISLNTNTALVSLFFKDTPLHDGAVIIKDGIIVAASCFITKLGAADDLDSDLGTRHRAGIGITEETDAVTVIVSEETGAVSLAYRGRLAHNVEKPRLRRHLNNFMAKKKKPQPKKGNVVQSGIQNITAKVFDDTSELDGGLES